MKYSNGKIYAIRSAQTDDIYIGSTIQPLCVRMAKHRAIYKGFLNEKYYFITSFKILQFEDAYIELIEIFPCSCKEELTKREGELIRENKNCINKRIEGRTKKEYYSDNKGIFAEKYKQYYQDNKDKKIAYAKQYCIDNKDKISTRKTQYRQKNKDAISVNLKQYYETNKEKLLVKGKQYYENNKTEILAKQAEKFTCICGKIYTYGNKPRHEKSLKHQQYISLHTKTE